MGVIAGMLLMLLLQGAAWLAWQAVRRTRAAYGWPTSEQNQDRQVRVVPGTAYLHGEPQEVIIADVNWRSRPGRRHR